MLPLCCDRDGFSDHGVFQSEILRSARTTWEKRLGRPLKGSIEIPVGAGGESWDEIVALNLN